MAAIHVLFAGGGTGGHLFPGIAVARELRRRHPEIEVVFVGSGRALEARVLSREGFTLERIRAGGLVGKSWGQRLRGLALVPVGLVDAARVVRQYSPRLIVGLGGYSSGPVVLWGAVSRRPTMLLEQNVVPGMTNRWLSRIVRLSALSSDAAVPHFPGAVVVSGNPVRPGFFEIPPPPRAPDVVHLLVVGGSQGAQAINAAMGDAAGAIAASARPIRVTHQTGSRDADVIRERYRQAGVSARVEPFFDDMDRVMTDVDLVVCRAGATTLAEIAAAGRPAVLIPFPYATHDHQRRNAEVVREAGAAEIIDQAELTGDRLAGHIVALADDDDRRAALAAASRRLARPDAAAVIVEEMERLASLNQNPATTASRGARAG